MFLISETLQIRDRGGHVDVDLEGLPELNFDLLEFLLIVDLAALKKIDETHVAVI